MGDHHPLGCRRRPRGVLEEGESLPPRLRVPPVRRQVGRQLVGGAPGQSLEVRQIRDPTLESRIDGARGERHLRTRVGDDRTDARHRPVGTRRVGRHRGGTGVETAEEGHHVVEARRVEQQSAPAPRPEVLEQSPESPRPAVELGIGQALLLHLLPGALPPLPSVAPLAPLGSRQEAVGQAFRLMKSAPAQNLDQRGELRAVLQDVSHSSHARPPLSRRAPAMRGAGATARYGSPLGWTRQPWRMFGCPAGRLSRTAWEWPGAYCTPVAPSISAAPTSCPDRRPGVS